MKSPFTKNLREQLKNHRKPMTKMAIPYETAKK